MNKVLKDKLGKIFDPLIPRYEKFKKTVAAITTNDKGTAIKFDSGFMICFGSINVNVNGGSDYYGIFNRTSSTLVTLPEQFISADDISINLTSQNFGVFSAIVNSKTINSFSFYAFYPATVSFTSTKINYVAYGKWK